MNENLIIWDMCPYCEEEVELIGTRLQACPNCGLHIQPSDEAIETAIMEDEL